MSEGEEYTGLYLDRFVIEKVKALQKFHYTTPYYFLGEQNIKGTASRLQGALNIPHMKGIPPWVAILN